jgi:hypothetical protein
MRRYRFEADGRPYLGAEQAGGLIDLAAAHAGAALRRALARQIPLRREVFRKRHRLRANR